MTEDKAVEVTFALSSNKITIEKVDADDNSIKLAGAKLKLERLPDENTDDVAAGLVSARIRIRNRTNNKVYATSHVKYPLWNI